MIGRWRRHLWNEATEFSSTKKKKTEPVVWFVLIVTTATMLPLHHVTSSVSPHHRYHLARAPFEKVFFFSSFLCNLLFECYYLAPCSSLVPDISASARWSIWEKRWTSRCITHERVGRLRASQLTKKKEKKPANKREKEREREKKKWSRASVFWKVN